MSRKTIEIFGELFPHEKIHTQEYWSQHISIIQNTAGGADHLGTLGALLMERVHFFRKKPDSRNGLLVLMVATTAWSLIRTLAGITGDEREWFRQKYNQFEDAIFYENWADMVEFIERMHRLYEIQTFLRHPSHKLKEYEWVFYDKWPEDKASLIADTADDLDLSLIHI